MPSESGRRKEKSVSSVSSTKLVKLGTEFRHHKSYITNATPPLQSQLSGAIIKAGALLVIALSTDWERERGRERETTLAFLLAWK